MADTIYTTLPNIQAIDSLTGEEMFYATRAGSDYRVSPSQMSEYMFNRLYPQRGVIYTKSSNFIIGDFTVNNAAAAVSGGNLVMSGGSAKNDWSHSVVVTRFRDSDNQVTIKIRFTLNNTSGAISVGKLSVNNWYTVGLMAQFDFSDGKVKFFPTGAAPAGNTPTISSTTGVTITANTTYELSYRVSKGIVIISVSRLNTDGTTAETVKISKQLSNTDQQFIKGNTSQFAIATHGGQQTVKFLEISRQSRKGLPISKGDSKTDDIGTISYDDGYTSVIDQRTGIPSNNFAGNGDRIEECVMDLETVLEMEPPFVRICIGRNNLGSPLGFTPEQKQKLIDYVAALNAAGILVFFIGPIPELAIADQSELLNWLIAQFGANRVLDVSPSVGSYALSDLMNAPYDNIHPNSLFNIILGQFIADNPKYRMCVNAAKAAYDLKMAA